MGDMSSPQTIPAQMAEPINDKASALGPAASAHKPTTTKDSAGRIPPPVRKSGQGQSGMAFADQLEKRHMPTSPTSENGPFGMAAMASALPHNGYQHPPPPGGHRHYNHQTSHPIMQHMPPNPYIGHHPGSIMVSGYYVQQPQMHQYYAANGHPSQHPMHGRANSGYYPVPFAMEHPQSPGYYPQAPQFPEPNHQRPDMMNRQYSQGHIQQEGRNQPRRPPHRTNKSFRDQTLPQGTPLAILARLTVTDLLQLILNDHNKTIHVDPHESNIKVVGLAAFRATERNLNFFQVMPFGLETSLLRQS